MRAKNVRKKVVGKSAKNVLYSHQYRDQKMGGKNARNNFSRTTRIVRSKNVAKKIVGKKCENVFYIYTNIMTKNGGKKTRETIFPETHV